MTQCLTNTEDVQAGYWYVNLLFLIRKLHLPAHQARLLITVIIGDIHMPNTKVRMHKRVSPGLKLVTD